MSKRAVRPLFSLRAACVTAVLGASTLATATATANGRYPGADELLVSPKDPATKFIHGSFGMFVTKDSGATWHWICDDVVEPSLAADSVSPSIAIFERGAIAVGSINGIRTSSDDGCTFVAATGTAGLRIRDIAKQRGATRAVAITAPADASASTVLETTDDGVSWHPLGTPLPQELVVQNIELTQTDSKRLYVSGTAQFSYSDSELAEAGLPANRVGVVYTSEDNAATWRRTIFPKAISAGSDVYVSAVDPTNADLVYARSSFQTSATDHDGVLLVSHDGMKTFDVVLHEPRAALLGFALSADGSKIATALNATNGQDGVYVATRDALDFTRSAPDALACLTWAVDGTLYGCQNLFTPTCNPSCPYVVATSSDAITWKPLLDTLANVLGPKDCPASTPYPGTCVPIWDTTWRCKLQGCDAGTASETPDAGTVVSGLKPGGSDGCSTPRGPGRLSLGVLLGLSGVAVARVWRRRRERALRSSRRRDG